MGYTRLNPSFEKTQVTNIHATAASGFTITSETYYTVGPLKLFYVAVKTANAVNANTYTALLTLPWTSGIGVAFGTETYSTVNIQANGNVQATPTVNRPAGSIFYVKGIVV